MKVNWMFYNQVRMCHSLTMNYALCIMNSYTMRSIASPPPLIFFFLLCERSEPVISSVGMWYNDFGQILNDKKGEIENAKRRKKALYQRV